MPNEADRFRKQAEEARLQAEKAISPLDKEAWLKVAGEWIKLAQSVEERQREKRLIPLPCQPFGLEPFAVRMERLLLPFVFRQGRRWFDLPKQLGSFR